MIPFFLTKKYLCDIIKQKLLKGENIMAKSNLIKKTKTMVVFVKSTATEEELKEVNRLVSIGWTSKPCITKEEKEKNKIKHKVDEKFNISYDEVLKEDMIEYLEKYKSEKEQKDFAYHAFRTINKEIVYNKDGKPRFNMISAKQYFYKTFFPEKWEEIDKKLKARQWQKKNKEETEDKLLKWFND